MSNSDTPEGAVERVRAWIRARVGTELPCGCIAADGRGERFSDDTTVTDRERNTVRTIEYANCTKHENEWVFTIECDHCGASWEKRERAGPKIDYGDENPDAKMKLESKRRGRFVNHNEVPIVQNE